MDFQFDDALPVLQRTPRVLRELLHDLPANWTTPTEGPGTWSAFDVVVHLIDGERTVWMPRVRHLLKHGDALPFPTFDREGLFEAAKARALAQLLDEFHQCRRESLEALTALELTAADLVRTGRHPEFGVVTLGQLLATWVTHDCTHISQIVRVMARQYTDAVGPWRAYLSIMKPR